MEDCLAGNAPRCQDITSTSSTYYSSGCISMNDLELCLTASAQDIGLFPGDNSIGNVVTPQKCFSNSDKFPVTAVDKGNAQSVLMTMFDHVWNDNVIVYGVISWEPDTIPSPKLVSAMKGSRGSQGIEPKKLSVMWAPDVYDPTPTSLSHVPSSRNQLSHNAGKKYRKNKKHKGSDKSSQGSKGKKQARKNGIEG